MQETVLAFFRNYELACNSGNTDAAAKAFAESFFYADGAISRALPRAAISAAATQRRELMANAGLTTFALSQIDLSPLDQHYIWAATTWTSNPAPELKARKAVELRATYLVEVREERVSIVAYFSHTNFTGALSASQDRPDKG